MRNLSLLLILILLGCRTINRPPQSAERKYNYVIVGHTYITENGNTIEVFQTYHVISTTDAKRLFKNENNLPGESVIIHADDVAFKGK